MNNRISTLDFKKVFETIERTPLIVSFLSGKGGVGKSVVAFNCASELAGLGYKTLLVDSDWDFGTQHLLANINPERTLSDIIIENGDLSENIETIGDKLGLIASPASRKANSRFIPESYQDFLSGLTGSNIGYDAVIIDTPSSQLEIIKDTASVSAMNIMVINPEITSMANSYGLFKFLTSSISGFNAHLFVNRVRFGSDSEYMYQKFAVLAERFIGRTPMYSGYLHESESVTDAVSRQLPVSSVVPESETTDQILNLCKFFTKEIGAKADNKVNVQKSSINSKSRIAEIKDRV